jgi:DNA-binding NarL/FixJ family response regulator
MQHVEQTLQNGVPQTFEYQVAEQDGATGHYEARLVVSGAQADEVLAIVRNITQRKARETLIEAERSRIARDLHDGLAHSLYLLGLKLDYRRHFSAASPTCEPVNTPDIAPLSKSELDILRLVAQGLSNSDIGLQLGLAEKTVSNRLTVIFNKLHVDNRVQATLFALREGLVSLDGGTE